MTSMSFRHLGAWVPVSLCTLVLPLCALVIRPWVELGIIDDWSYIRTAQVLANTGHITYNGWATAMLGWQLYVGALMIKLFGFSFTAPRVGTLLVAMGVGALTQRLYVRLGLSEWNSAAVTLIFLCSPPFMAVTYSFMSDVYGMLVLLGCCYCCVRAVQAEAEKAALWVSVAAIAAGIGGTARQIAWVGVLVMVPCTLWLLRRNRRALWLGGGCAIIGIAIIPLSLSWFNHQPFALPELAFPVRGTSLAGLLLKKLPNFTEQVGFELLFLATPLLLSLLGTVLRFRRSLFAMGIIIVYWAVRIPFLIHSHHLQYWTVPYMFNNFWFYGWDYLPASLGSPALLLTIRVRIILTLLVLAGELGLAGLLFAKRRSASAFISYFRPTRHRATANILLILGSATLAYLFLLLPRYLGAGLLDRYLLFPEFVLLVVVVLLYQKSRAQLPAAAWVLAIGYIVANTIGMHDAFSQFRAQATLLDRVQATGVARNQLDGGIEFNGWTEILTTGHLNDPRIRIPAGVYRYQPVILPTDLCHTQFLELTPSIHARYVVSFDPNACGGRTGFQESFTTWLGPRTQTLYAVKGPE